MYDRAVPDRHTWTSLAWWRENVDTVAVIVVVVVMSILGAANITSPQTITQTLPAILGVFAIAMLRDRSRFRDGDRRLAELTEKVSKLDGKIDELSSLRVLTEKVERLDTKIDELSSLRVLQGREIEQFLRDARKDTILWMFRGGTGTYTRAVTLPKCIEAARPNNRVLQVRVEIIDPTDLPVCEEYASLYRRLASDADDDAAGWTAEETSRESYATVLALCWYVGQYAPLSVEVGLSTTISTFRYDVSSRYLVITQRGPQFPAILVERTRPQYDYWRFELDTSFSRSRRLPISQVTARIRLDPRPTTTQVRRLFEELSIPLADAFSDVDVDDIITKAVERDRTPLLRGAGDRGRIAV